VGCEHILRERAPADILDELRLFLGSRAAAFFLDLAQDANGFDIVADLLLGSAFADAIGIGDAIVEARTLLDLLDRLG